MTRPVPRHALILTLALALAAMSLAAGMARGQMRAGGETLVLCSGGGLVQVTRDGAGQPTGKSHLCPDLVAGLFAALAAPPPEIARPATLAAAPAVAAVMLPITDTARTFRARAPPVAV